MLKTTNGFARGAKYIQLSAARAKDHAASNRSMNVRAKQRLCYQRCSLLSRLSLAVSPHVISVVRRFVIKNIKSRLEKLITKHAPRFPPTCVVGKRHAEDADAANRSMHASAVSGLLISGA